MKFKHIISLLIFFLASIYITYPLIFHLGDYATGIGDELVIAWIHNWVIQSVLRGDIFQLFEANLYYPFHNSLAFSDLFFTTSIFSIIPLKFIQEPIAVVNFTFISSLVLLGFSIYLLSYYITKNFFASLLSGFLVIFSPAVLDKKVHLQILAVEWVPLSILFFLIFIKKKNSKYLVYSLLCFLLQTYTSFLPGYFIVFSYLVILLFNWISDKKKIQKLLTKRNILYVFFSILLIVPIAIPYYQVSQQFKYVRDIRDAVHLALHPEDLIYPGQETRLNELLLTVVPTNKFSQNSEFKPGYLGLVFSLLVLFALWQLIKNYKKSNVTLKSFVLIAGVGLVLSLGPVLHLGRQTVHLPFPIPLPYALFYYILPGFQGFRNAARWEMLFIICISIVISIIIQNFTAKYSFKKRFFIFLLLFLGIIAEFNFPIKYYSIPQKKDFPQVYYWLATTKPDSKIIELPIYNWNMSPFTQNEIWREYYGTVHFRSTVNGYTGFSPPPWQTLVTNMTINFPSEETIKELKRLGINYIIIHENEYDALHKSKITINNRGIKNANEVIKMVRNTPSLKQIKKFNNTFVFELEY